MIGQFASSYTDPQLFELDRLLRADPPEHPSAYRGGQRRAKACSPDAAKMRAYRARQKARAQAARTEGGQR